MWIVLIAMLIVGCLAFYLDWKITLIGLAKGSAIEDDTVVVWLFGNKPDEVQLFLGILVVDGPVMILTGLIGFAGIGAQIMGCGILAGLVVRHIQNYLAWKKLGA